MFSCIVCYVYRMLGYSLNTHQLLFMHWKIKPNAQNKRMFIVVGSMQPSNFEILEAAQHFEI